MKSIPVFMLGLFVAGCTVNEVDRIAPGVPRRIRTVSLDNAVEIRWLANSEPDIDEYKVWVGTAPSGQYVLIGTTVNTTFIDNGANNGTTYYYALSAVDFNGNESGLSAELVYDTPRPEGYGEEASNYLTAPNSSGYDFSTYSIGPYDDDFTDVFYEHFNGIFYLNVWDDTDIQDMGYTSNLDEISVAPTQGWAPSRSVEAIPGHTYVVWTWDDHYAKVRVISVSTSLVVFDWAYQTAPQNPELKRSIPPDGKRSLKKKGAVALHR
ncbi:MAG: hypothetical protein L0Y80_04090 [Ignavibacteriae bacterium]|nr:hypothetical protein [Ignavibacteriota bacterium]